MKNSSSCQISAAAAVRSIRWWNICTSSSRGVELSVGGSQFFAGVNLFSIEKNWTVNWLNGINRNRPIIDFIVGRRVNSWGPIKTHYPFYSLHTVCCFGLPRAQHCGSRGPLDLPLISGQRANWWGRKEEGGGTSSAQSSSLCSPPTCHMAQWKHRDGLTTERERALLGKSSWLYICVCVFVRCMY